MEAVKVNISDFASGIGYCQYLVVNKYHLNLRPKETIFLQKGRMAHKTLEEEDKLVPRREATKEELMDPFFPLDFTREGVQVSIERENMNLFRYVGRTDKIIRANGSVIILDDKVISTGIPRESVYPDRLIQLSAYCEGFIRNYSHMLAFNEICFKIVQRNPDNEILKETMFSFDEEARELLQKSFTLFESLYNKTAQPQHHNNPNKCRACRYFDCCQWRLVNPTFGPNVA